MGLLEFIPDDLQPSQLDKLGQRLSNEVSRLGKVVAQYENNVLAKTKEYKRELAIAKTLHKDSKYTPTMINAMAETSERVVKAEQELLEAETILNFGKAELEGRDKQYQMVKKLIDLKVQELRTFRG